MDFAGSGAHEKRLFYMAVLEALCECFLKSLFYRKAIAKTGEQNRLIDHYRKVQEPFMQAGMRSFFARNGIWWICDQLLRGCLLHLVFLNAGFSESDYVGVRTDCPRREACIKSCAEIAEISKARNKITPQSSCNACAICFLSVDQNSRFSPQHGFFQHFSNGMVVSPSAFIHTVNIVYNLFHILM